MIWGRFQRRLKSLWGAPQRLLDRGCAYIEAKVAWLLTFVIGGRP